MVMVRSATRDDAPILRQFMHALHAYLEPLDPDLGRADAILDRNFAHVSRLVAESRGVFLLAEDAGVPVGMAAVLGLVAPEDQDERDDPFGVVTDLYVVPEARSSGAGALLMAAAEDHVRALGAYKLVVKALVRNERALTFYDRAGYERRVVEFVKRF